MKASGQGLPLLVKDRMKLDSEIKWISPYLESVEDLVPLSKVKMIKVSPYRKGFPSYHGLIETKNFRHFTITVRVYSPFYKNKTISKLNQECLLSHLAHELSHLVHWNDYVVERFELETSIYRRFGKKLLELGYELDRNKV